MLSPNFFPTNPPTHHKNRRRWWIKSVLTAAAAFLSVVGQMVKVLRFLAFLIKEPSIFHSYSFPSSLIFPEICDIHRLVYEDCRFLVTNSLPPQLASRDPKATVKNQWDVTPRPFQQQFPSLNWPFLREQKNALTQLLSTCSENVHTIQSLPIKTQFRTNS